MKTIGATPIIVATAVIASFVMMTAFHGKSGKQDQPSSFSLDSPQPEPPQTPTRRTSERQCIWYPPRPVFPSSEDIGTEGKAEYSEILGEAEALHVKLMLSGLDVKQRGPIPYKRTEATTTLFVPESPKLFFTFEQFLAGEIENTETETRIVLTIDNRTGEILIPDDAPVIPENELDEICRSLLERLKKERGWKFRDDIWMDEVRRVSDWYYVSYRIREEPYRKGEEYWFYTFWIDSRTRQVPNNQCGILYSDR